MTAHIAPPNGVYSTGSRPTGGPEGQNNNLCPRHGPHYVIRRGTNQCPKGRKKREVCK